jgi:hypothetical protein
MNRENAKDYLPLVQALAEGKVIQFKFAGGWADDPHPVFSGNPSGYRIKPEPREVWRNRFPSGVECGTFYSKEEARQGSLGKVQHVRYREVIE